jgi:predicted MPP superfamily phosphohydrolase
MAGAAAMLHLFPYHATAGGVHFRVEGTLLTRSGITADTTFGSWVFGNVDGLPVGVHISPENVDVVRMAAAATQNGQAYVDGLRADVERQVPQILAWLLGEALIGVVLGLLAAAAVNLALRYLRHGDRRRDELRLRARQLVGVGAALAGLAVFGALTYNPHWAKESRLTGTLGALQLFPGQLKAYYQQQATAFDVVSGVASIQASLQKHIEQTSSKPTSFDIMFISDMHLASTYPLVKQYASNFAVQLIVNTGDESSFGTAAEMTPEYLDQLRDITKTVPMIWLAGNHDSPTTVQIMRSIPGVIVVGDKTERDDAGFDVTAQELEAYGLTIAGIPDPRVYGAAGAYGADAAAVVDPLQQKAVDAAVKDVPPDARFDIFASHEPVATERLVHDLPGQIRQVNSGHTHHQNAAGDVQRTGQPITLVEGSTGAGGLKNVDDTTVPEPIEFSIESVAADCQFTKIIRFQVVGPGPTGGDVIPTTGQNVSATTLYLNPQHLDTGHTPGADNATHADTGRTCGTARGIGSVRALPHR